MGSVTDRRAVYLAGTYRSVGRGWLTSYLLPDSSKTSRGSGRRNRSNGGLLGEEAGDGEDITKALCLKGKQNQRRIVKSG